ncbi:hypothetical protein D3C87_431410 [compost metagenome]
MKQLAYIFRNLLTITILSAASVNFTSAQCPSGAIGVSGPGCGCLSGCNLTSFGGPNCGSGVTGNCSGGQRSMSVNIVVPAGCTYTVTATMRDRAGCGPGPGADNGDQMKVDNLSGGKGFQTGTGNATLNDSYTLVGPGTIRVSGTANRADEIITYTTTSSGATCVNCMSTLPVELTAFNATLEGNAVACEWITETELNNDFFTIERSTDGIHFEPIAYMKGAGNSLNPLRYKMYDYDPYMDIVSYYRLSQTDFDGSTRQHEIRSVRPQKTHELVIFPNPSKGTVQITGDYKTLLESKLFDLSGREIALNAASAESNEITISDLSVGVYTFVYFNNNEMVSERIVVTP